MTKQDMIRSLKKDIEDLKVFFLVVILLTALFGALVGTYKGYVIVSDAVQKAFEPTAEEIEAAEKAAEEQKLFNRLMADCESRTPVGWRKYDQYSFCYHQVMKKMKKK